MVSVSSNLFIDVLIACFYLLLSEISCGEKCVITILSNPWQPIGEYFYFDANDLSGCFTSWPDDVLDYLTFKVKVINDLTKNSNTTVFKEVKVNVLPDRYQKLNNTRIAEGRDNEDEYKGVQGGTWSEGDLLEVQAREVTRSCQIRVESVDPPRRPSANFPVFLKKWDQKRDEMLGEDQNVGKPGQFFNFDAKTIDDCVVDWPEKAVTLKVMRTMNLTVWPELLKVKNKIEISNANISGTIESGGPKADWKRGDLWEVIEVDGYKPAKPCTIKASKSVSNNGKDFSFERNYFENCFDYWLKWKGNDIDLEQLNKEGLVLKVRLIRDVKIWPTSEQLYSPGDAYGRYDQGWEAGDFEVDETLEIQIAKAGPGSDSDNVTIISDNDNDNDNSDNDMSSVFVAIIAVAIVALLIVSVVALVVLFKWHKRRQADAANAAYRAANLPLSQN